MKYLIMLCLFALMGCGMGIQEQPEGTLPYYLIDYQEGLSLERGDRMIFLPVTKQTYTVEQQQEMVARFQAILHQLPETSIKAILILFQPEGTP